MASDWLTLGKSSGGGTTGQSVQTVAVTGAENRSLTSARTASVKFTTAGGKTATLTVTQPKAEITFGTLTAALSYGTAPAGGGEVSPQLTWSLPFGFNGDTSNGGVISGGADGTATVTAKDSHVPATIETVTVKATYTAVDGYTRSTLGSGGVVTVKSCGTTVYTSETIVGQITAAVTVSIYTSGSSGWGSVRYLGNATAQASVKQAENALLSATWGTITVEVTSPDGASYSCDHTGGSFTVTAKARQEVTRTYTSGVTDVELGVLIPSFAASGSWISLSGTSSSRAVTVAANTAASARQGTVTVSAANAGVTGPSVAVTITQEAKPAATAAGTITFRITASQPAAMLNAYFGSYSSGDDIWASVWDNADDNSNEPFYVLVGTLVSVSTASQAILMTVETGSDVSSEVSQLRNGDLLECDPLYIGRAGDGDPETEWSPPVMLAADEDETYGEFASVMLADAMEAAAAGGSPTLECQLNT